ncbi:MAG TPA: hypothetical protein VE464_13655 [Streptosporangiaceae bacterium]|nr:hypothetical protein [Streptosporangiaceae bacterium]
MLYVFGFQRTAVVLSDLYFVDPHPKIKGQESPEHGVRLEVRKITSGPLQGSIYSAQPIEIGDLIWRADLLESVDGPPGSFDRTHHHPGVSRGLEPGRRVFDQGLSAAPVEWVGAQLADLEALLDQAGVGGDPADAADAQSLRDCLHEVLESLDRLLERVQVGELGRPPAEGPLASVRASWL